MKTNKHLEVLTYVNSEWCCKPFYLSGKKLKSFFFCLNVSLFKCFSPTYNQLHFYFVHLFTLIHLFWSLFWSVWLLICHFTETPNTVVVFVHYPGAPEGGSLQWQVLGIHVVPQRLSYISLFAVNLLLLHPHCAHLALSSPSVSL